MLPVTAVSLSVQVKVYVVEVVRLPVGCEPVEESKVGDEFRVHDAAHCAFQLMVAVPPYSTLAGLAVTITSGVGLATCGLLPSESVMRVVVAAQLLSCALSAAFSFSRVCTFARM